MTFKYEDFPNLTTKVSGTVYRGQRASEVIKWKTPVNLKDAGSRRTLQNFKLRYLLTKRWFSPPPPTIPSSILHPPFPRPSILSRTQNSTPPPPQRLRLNLPQSSQGALLSSLPPTHTNTLFLLGTGYWFEIHYYCFIVFSILLFRGIVQSEVPSTSASAPGPSRNCILVSHRQVYCHHILLLVAFCKVHCFFCHSTHRWILSRLKLFDARISFQENQLIVLIRVAKILNDWISW